jgi:hypothetical protein
VSTAFCESGFVVAEQLLERPVAALIYDIFLLRVWRGEGRRDDHVQSAFSFWGDTTIDALLTGLSSRIGALVGRPLLPTYGYGRIYTSGDRLAPHRDRAACEVTATIHLGSDGGAPPPICLEPDCAFAQHPGDAVIFLGDQITHWRDTYRGRSFGQMFLNYVYGDGSRATLVYDGRRNAFPPGWLDRGAQP